ncbi:MAG: hypothetical protein L0Z62_01310 [Gemmataceae bacterium]|nr:hypothetical protein [Gemmataceae bacterium]
MRVSDTLLAIAGGERLESPQARGADQPPHRLVAVAPQGLGAERQLRQAREHGAAGQALRTLRAKLSEVRRGWSTLYRPGRHLQDVRVCRIYEGTDEILKLKVAEAVLGRKEYEAYK